jgi:predicted RNA-binding Zn-ribbon protein involved in translation (DUF1610 family)
MRRSFGTSPKLVMPWGGNLTRNVFLTTQRYCTSIKMEIPNELAQEYVSPVCTGFHLFQVKAMRKKMDIDTEEEQEEILKHLPAAGILLNDIGNARIALHERRTK